MDEPVVSSHAASSLVKVTVIYQIAPLNVCTFSVGHLHNQSYCEEDRQIRTVTFVTADKTTNTYHNPFIICCASLDHIIRVFFFVS